MAKFKVIVSDPQAGTSKVVELEEARASPIHRKKTWRNIRRLSSRFTSTQSAITRRIRQRRRPNDGKCSWRCTTRVVLSGGAGFKAKKKGERRRKTVRGNIITDEIAQINMKIVERPAQAAEASASQSKRTISLIFCLLHA